MRTSANKKDKGRCRLPSWRLHEKYLKMALFIEKNRKKWQISYKKISDIKTNNICSIRESHILHCYKIIKKKLTSLYRIANKKVMKS